MAEAGAVDAAGRAALKTPIPLAPLHQPQSLSGIDAVARLRPGLPQAGGAINRG